MSTGEANFWGHGNKVSFNMEVVRFFVPVIALNNDINCS